LEIEVKNEDWIKFWEIMDDIKLWNWKKSYGFETEEEFLKDDPNGIFINVDGDIWSLKISKHDKKN